MGNWPKPISRPTLMEGIMSGDGMGGMLELHADEFDMPTTVRKATKMILRGAIIARPETDPLDLDPLTELAKIGFNPAMAVEVRMDALKYLARFMHPIPKTVKVEIPAPVDHTKVERGRQLMEKMQEMVDKLAPRSNVVVLRPSSTDSEPEITE